MDAEEFRIRGKEMVDFIADYLKDIKHRPVFPDVKQGYLKKLVPDAAPQQAESWEDVFADIERVIMPGITHWHSPRFHAYYPTGNSFPAILGDMLSDAIGCVGFSWSASPACTELETVTMDWLAKMLALPEHFLFSSKGPGGGVIQGTASEACYVSLLAAKHRAVTRAMQRHPALHEEDVWGKLICYQSDQAHTAAERAAMMASVKCRSLPTTRDEDFALRGVTLAKAIEEDEAKGLIPFYVLATLGTTGCCAFDNLEEVGPICNAKNLWLHVDAAYAGSAFICPEYRQYLHGVEHVDSFNFNPHKWMLVNFDCSVLWLKDTSLLTNAFQIDLPILIRQPDGQEPMPDYRHWQIALGRRFRSLKLWFVLRLYGVKGLQEHIRMQIGLAKEFEQLVRTDSRFEVAIPVRMGLVCFRLKTSNEDTADLLHRVNAQRNIHLTHSTIGGEYVIRFVICTQNTTSDDVRFSWNFIQRTADQKTHPY